MIELYTFTTPNGRKPAIMLEEVGLPYQIKMINISQGEQFSAKYMAINPNRKIPAIIDMPNYPWVVATDYMGVSLTEYSQVQRWINTMRERPAVKRGMALSVDS